MEAVIEKLEPAVAASNAAISSEIVGEKIRQIEETNDLLQYEVDGWCIWPLLRVSAALELMQLPFTVSKETFKFRELCAIAARDSYHLLFPRKSRFVVLTLSSELMEKDGDRFKDVFFDDLLVEVGSYFKIETLNSKSFLTRSKAALIPSNLTSTAFGMMATLVLPKFGSPSSISPVANQLSACLVRQPGLESFSAERIAGRLQDFYWRKKLFSWLLDRIKPQYLFTADGYSDHASIAAAKERRIEVCEFQHGGFIKGGPEYGWSSYALPYKSRMPIPDRFFLFGDYWKEQLEDGGFWQTTLRSVGSLRMDQYRANKTKFESNRKSGARRIVLTTQGVDTERLIQFVDEFLRMTQKSEVELYLKLHPVYEAGKELYERSLSAHQGVTVITGSEEPSTFELLSSADLHVSVSSTCHFEALGLGVPTVILPLAGCDWVLPLYRRGHALLATTPEALLAIVRNLEDHSVPESLSAYYFQPNAVENMQRALVS